MTVIGTGYLGATHAACMAELGHEVLGVDVDESKIEALKNGRVPFYEPGLPEVLERNIEAGRLDFSTSYDDAAEFANVHFLGVGTPQAHGSYAADLTYVKSVITELVPRLKGEHVIFGKSTVPVGTAAELQEMANELAQDTPFIVTDLQTAELVKVSANAFLATKISFINAVSEICEIAGADVVKLADAIGYDERIGRKFLGAGLGFGGGCLPKDIRAFMARAGELGADQALTFLREVDAINMRRRDRTVDMAKEAFQGSLLGHRVTVLGCAFKPNSDDVRDSPALSVAGSLSLAGAAVTVYDPEGMENARKVFPTLNYAADCEEALRESELVILATEWQEFRQLDPAEVAELVTNKHIIDGRNVLDVEAWKQAGWTIEALGRSL